MVEMVTVLLPSWHKLTLVMPPVTPRRSRSPPWMGRRTPPMHKDEGRGKGEGQDHKGKGKSEGTDQGEGQGKGKDKGKGKQEN